MTNIPELELISRLILLSFTLMGMLAGASIAVTVYALKEARARKYDR